MSTTLGTLITSLRYKLNESTARFWDDTELIALANEGGKTLAVDSLCLQTERTWKAVAYQPNYALPAGFIGAKSVQFKEKYDLFPFEDYDEYRRVRGTTVQQTGTPHYYYIQPDIDTSAAIGWLMIDPVSTSSSPNTTLAGAYSASASTTIACVDTAYFQKTGSMIIDTEVIRFRRNNTSNDELTIVQRGVEQTTVANHASTAAVYLRDLRLVYYTTPDSLSTTADYLQIPDKWIDALQDLMLSYAWLKDNDLMRSDRMMAIYKDRMTKALRGSRRTTPEKIKTIQDWRVRGFGGRPFGNPLSRIP